MELKDCHNTAILLMAYGGPDSPDAVKPFLTSIISPRPVTDEQLTRVKDRYSRIGGKSPLIDITKSQANALEEKLLNQFKNIKCYVGMRYWHPFIKDTLNTIISDGAEKIIAISMAPHNSIASTGGYKKALDEATTELTDAPKISFASNWHNHPAFLQLIANRIHSTISELNRDETYIIFSAHSLPVERVKDDPYVSQLNETINGVMEIVGNINHSLAYQSKGRGQTEWLGPEVEEVLGEIAATGYKNVIVVPFGFVSDHIETLYDIDISFKEKADSLSLNFKRTPSLNNSADFINALSLIVSKDLKNCEENL